MQAARGETGEAPSPPRRSLAHPLLHVHCQRSPTPAQLLTPNAASTTAKASACGSWDPPGIFSFEKVRPQCFQDVRRWSCNKGMTGQGDL